eukprot:1600906-Alexandrium_andersonii.AAC.1
MGELEQQMFDMATGNLGLREKLEGTWYAENEQVLATIGLAQAGDGELEQEPAEARPAEGTHAPDNEERELREDDIS